MLRKILCSSLILILAACGPITVRKDHEPEKTPTQRESTPGEVKAPEVVETTPIAVPPTIQKEKPEIGILLGPGGVKAFAHIGVLRAFEKANIPIKAVVGVEWGSLIAGLYSKKGKTNEIEWQMQKLKEDNLPEKGLLSSKVDAENPNKLDSFLEKAFENYNLASGTVRFSCPIANISMPRTTFVLNGSAKREIKKCMALPPLFKNSEGWYANTDIQYDLKDLFQRAGVKYWILVDVIASDKANLDSSLLDQEAEKILWMQIRKEFTRMRSSFQYTILVNTSNVGRLDLSQGRSLIKTGETAAGDVVKTLKQDFSL